MVRIAISQAAFEAIARTLPFGNVSFENKTAWAESHLAGSSGGEQAAFAARSRELFSDVILRIAERQCAGSPRRPLPRYGRWPRKWSRPAPQPTVNSDPAWPNLDRKLSDAKESVASFNDEGRTPSKVVAALPLAPSPEPRRSWWRRLAG